MNEIKWGLSACGERYHIIGPDGKYALCNKNLFMWDKNLSVEGNGHRCKKCEKMLENAMKKLNKILNGEK